MSAAQITGQMVTWALDGVLVLLCAGILLCLIRVVRGPHLADRAIALDTIGVNLIGFVIVATLRGQTLMLFDGAMVLSLLGFAGTVAVGIYLARPHIRARLEGQAGASLDAGAKPQRKEGGGK